MDELAQQRASNASPPEVLHDGEPDLGCLIVDEAVRVSVRRPPPEPRRTYPGARVLRNQQAIARSSPAGEQAREFGATSHLVDRWPLRAAPEERFIEHRLEKRQVASRSVANGYRRHRAAYLEASLDASMRDAIRGWGCLARVAPLPYGRVMIS